MTADENALLDNIAANPADDVARLVYADWLDEHDQAVRAEFIRLQVEIARLQMGPRAVVDQNVGLFKRQQEMLDAHMAEFLGPLAEIQTHMPPVFERGFLAELQTDWDGFHDYEDDLVGTRPRPAVFVFGWYDDFPEWRRSVALDLIVSLHLQTDSEDHLHVPAPTTPGLAEAWRKFSRLRTLNISANYLNDSGLRAIPWADLPALVDLDLSNNDLTDDGVIHLINTGLPQRLTRLVLGGNPIGDQAAYELADRVGSNAGLRHLNLRYTGMTNVGQNAVLEKFPGRVDLF